MFACLHEVSDFRWIAVLPPHPTPKDVKGILNYENHISSSGEKMHPGIMPSSLVVLDFTCSWGFLESIALAHCRQELLSLKQCHVASILVLLRSRVSLGWLGWREAADGNAGGVHLTYTAPVEAHRHRRVSADFLKASPIQSERRVSPELFSHPLYVLC